MRTPRSITTKLLEERLVAWLINRGSESRYTYEQIETMLKYDPIAAVANTSLQQGVISMLGEYAHEDEAIQEYVLESLALMKHSLPTFWQYCLSYVSHGTSIAHIKHIIRDKKAWLDLFTFIAPEHVTWKLKNRDIEYVKILGVSKEVSYAHIFHLVNDGHISPGKINPWGSGVGARAYKFWELEELLFTTLGTIGQKQAAKLLIGKVPDTDAEIEVDEIDPKTGENKITTSGEQMKEVLEATDSSSVVICEVGDEIEAVDQTIDGKFFDYVLHDLRTQRFLCFYQPQTIFSGNKSGVGDAGLASSQQETFLSFLEAKAFHLGAEFVEQVLRPLIDYNFGAQADYGSFQLNKQDPKALEVSALLLQIITAEGVITDEKERKTAYEKLKSLVGF
jgi:hypothetical protein